MQTYFDTFFAVLVLIFYQPRNPVLFFFLALEVYEYDFIIGFRCHFRRDMQDFGDIFFALTNILMINLETSCVCGLDWW